jgi:hypothetical protein
LCMCCVMKSFGIWRVWTKLGSGVVVAGLALGFAGHGVAQPEALPAGENVKVTTGTAAPLLVPVGTADLRSTLSQHAARTTTQTEPFRYELRHPEGLTLLYGGSRNSKMEPCGCRALNLGGIDKEAAMVQTIRRGNPQTLYMDAGGYFREFADPAMRLQTWFMLKALSALNCQVMNVGFPDLQQGMGALQYFKKEFQLPLVSANVVDGKTGKPVFDAFKEFVFTLADGSTVRVAVVGVTAASRDVSRGPRPLPTPGADGKGAAAIKEIGTKPGRWMIAETNGFVPWVPYDVHGGAAASGDEEPATSAKFSGGAAPAAAGGGKLATAVQFAVEGSAALSSGTLAPYRVLDLLPAAKELGAELRKNNDVVILLAYTSFEHAVAMSPELGDYDLVVASDYVDRMEPVRPAADGPLVVSGDHEGKYLGIVEIGKFVEGQRVAIAPADADMLPVLQTIEPLKQFHRYIERFAALTEQLPVEQAPTTSQKIYAGATSCRACHVTEFNQWKTHKHSHAMKTLVDKNMHYNPDCLKCHTVAYRQPGGFTDVRVTAYLANVQCEVCHGPAQAHVQEMRAAEAMQRQGKPVTPMKHELRMEWDQNFCMQCHDPQNDPQFQFNSDILRVRHKDPAPPRARPATMPLD